MHVGLAGIGHVWSLSSLPVLVKDSCIEALRDNPLIRPALERDAHLHTKGDARDRTLCISTETTPSRGCFMLPSVNNLISLIHEHRQKKNRSLSGHLYTQLCEYGLETDEDLGNHVVPMLVACGNLCTAQQIFEKIPYQGEHAWTSLLQGYVENGESYFVFEAFQNMQARNVHPTTHTFVALIKACEDLRDMKTGQELHAEVVGLGYEAQPFVTNSLLCMYAKCGLISEAENVFDQIPVRDTVAWTTLMGAYVECDLCQDAVNCLEEVQAEGVAPDAVMFVCSLKACASVGALDKGQIIHKEIVEEGLEVLPSIGNTLVDMYAKSGLLEEATEVFDELPRRDIVSWTALMNGYSESGLGENALKLFDQMQSEGMSSDQFMYVSGLKACCSTRSVHKGLELHMEIATEGFEVDRTSANTLIDFYSKCGLRLEAQAVFDELILPDVVSWTTLITGYAEHGLRDEVQRCLNKMQLKGCSPNILTYVCSLKACSQLDALNWGREMHAMFIKVGVEDDTLMVGALVDMYAKCGSFAEALAVMSQPSAQSGVAWSALIAGCAEEGASELALKCLQQMEDIGLSSNEIALVSSLKACSKAASLQCGYKLHTEVVKKGFETFQTCGNALVDMYAKCGSLPESQDVFDKLPIHDVIGWTALMAGYADNGFGKDALFCFEQMQLEGACPDFMLWNTAILCYAEEGEIEGALVLHAQMQEQCLLSNNYSFVNVLQGCSKTAAIEVGRRIHIQIQAAKDLEGSEEVLSTALIDMYGKCGSMVEALQVFDALPTRSLVQWNALITGYARKVETERVFLTFIKMREESVQPDVSTFGSILFACSHSGLLREGQMYYKSMVREYSMAPHVRHDSCMIDLLGRVGCLSEAVLMLQKVPTQEDSVAWNSVLGACSKLKDVELSEQAFHNLLNLGQEGPTSFIMMANIYADIAET